MGYRLRLGKVKKTEEEKYAGKTYEEVTEIIEKIEEDSAPYRPPFHTELFEIGKYVKYDKHMIPFYDFDIEADCEAGFYIMTKEGLKFIIGDYHLKVYNMYKNLSNESRRNTRAFFERRAREWDSSSKLKMNMNPYYLDEEKTDGEIAKSWQYEYAIFNLVHIYRTFDWDNDYLIYSGW